MDKYIMPKREDIRIIHDENAKGGKSQIVMRIVYGTPVLDNRRVMLEDKEDKDGR